ncbi:tape measure protein [Riemerella anatipestifer]|uniref:Tape measure protein N-terminal domain-containing protein n=1 Tax=Riemerella anatipestifer TaxID=34085 RepID=A0A1S7DQE9_RIEAN|nr:tape measure protein [Riemerella anatipestifer]AQY21334.1 hypothetical protein AB406_0375 [Riemerella anatipestifer]
MNQGALHFEALLTTKDFERGMERIRNDIRRASGLAVQETSKMDSVFKNLSIGIAGYFSGQALMGFARELINVRGEFQKTEIAFTTMLKSKEKANELMGQMVDLAAKTPFSLQEVSAGAKQLLAFQVPANEVVDTLTRMGNIAAGLGVPMSRINLVYGQVMAKGKLMGDDLRQFTEAGIPMVGELAKKFGKTTAEISTMVSEGRIGFNDVKEVLFSLTNEGGLFFNLMEEQSKTLSGKISNLGNAFDQMLNKIGEGSEGLLNSGIEGATYLVEHYEEVMEAIKGLVIVYGSYKAALITLNVTQEYSKKTIQSEIALLGISEKMKLGRALVTQKQAIASFEEAKAEHIATQEKYLGLQAEVQSLNVKKQKAIALATEKRQILANAQVELATAKQKLSALGAEASAREVTIATKRVEKAENKVLVAQENAEIARKGALTASSKFYTTQKELETVATRVSTTAKKVEVAQEALSVATKNANTIATTRLTVAQRLQVLAVRAGTKAQALFNSTILANPYALATALLVGLTYTIYKLCSQLTTAKQLQKDLNDKLSESKQEIAGQESQIMALVSAIKSENTTNEEKKRLIERLNSITQGKIQNLTVENIKTGQLDAAVKNYIQTLYKQAEAEVYLQDIKNLTAKKQANLDRINELKTNGAGIGDVLESFFDLKTYNRGANGEMFTWGATDALVSNIERENKDIDKALEERKKLIEKNASATSSIEPTHNVNNAVNETKKKAKAHQKALAEVYSKNSIKDLEERISLWNNALERATKDKDGNYQVKVRAKDKYGKEYETGQVVSKDKALEELKVLNEAKAKIEEEFRIKSTEEELSELKRRINLRDKYLQLGMNRPELINEDTVKNLFPDLKDKSYVQALEEKRKAYLGLIEAQKATEQTTKDLILIEEELKNAKGVETFMQGVNDRISELKERYKGAELIDKLKKAKSLQLGGTEEENLEKNKAYASALKEAQKDYDKFYRDLLEQQKTYEEKSLELQKEYAALKATERYKNATPEEQKKIEQAFSKRAIDLFFEEMAKKEEWAKMFADMNLVASSKLEEFKNILQQKLTEAKTIEEKIKIGEFIKKIDDTLRDRNPFKSLIKAINDLGDKSLSTEEKILRLTQAIDKSKSYLNDVKGVVSDVRGAFDDLGISTDNTFGDILSNVEQTLEGLNQMADGVMTFAQGFATKNPVQMVAGAIKTIGGLIKTVSGWLNGDNKRERNIKRWGQALEEVKEQYRALEHQISKTLGENVYKEQGKIIANLRQQQQMLQRMANEEAGKKKSDSGKIAEYRNQANEIDRQITDIIDKMKNDIAQTDAKSLADKMGDALFEAWQRGEDGAKAYEKTVDDVMRNAAKAALKQKLLEGPMQEMIDNLVKKMGFGGGDASIEAEIKKKESRLEEIQNEIKNGNIVQKTISAVKAMALKAQIEKLKKQYEDSKNINPNGSFDGLTPEEREEIKNQGKVAMNNYMEALKQYQDLFGAAEENADSLKGGIKGMSEETAGILAGQFNAIRIHVAEIQKNQGFGLDIAKSSLMNLTKIEENTRNLYQMRKDLSEMNSKIKSNDTRGLGL